MKVNKGEWSEFYAFLKLISQGEFYGANEKIEKIPTLCYKISKIFKKEKVGNLEFIPGKKVQILNTTTGNGYEIDMQIFINQSAFLLEEIKNGTGSSFEIPEIESFMNVIGCKKIKGNSREKSDIDMLVEDEKSGVDIRLGFSIKSQLGNPSTLLNPGKTTNLVYEIQGLDPKFITQINEINTGSKVIKRISKIKELGGKIVYKRIDSNRFEKNLILIDSKLPEILAEMILHYYSSNDNSISDLLLNVIYADPLSIGDHSKKQFYEGVIMQLLRKASLGMTPTREWDSDNEVTGGFLIVKKNGEVLCYHIYNKKSFEKYLIENTRFDTPSTTRYEHASVYVENNKVFIKLNFQIRFKK